MELFGEEEFFKKDESPEDTTRIAFTQLFYSEEELKKFKSLCKEGMRSLYPPEKLNDSANISDFLLKHLELHYAKNNS